MSPELPRYGNIPFEAAVAQATERMLERGGLPLTLLACGSQQNEEFVIEPLEETHHERRLQLALVGFEVGINERIGKLHQLFLASETWISLRKDGQAPMAPPSEDPDRVEALLIVGVNLLQAQSQFAAFEMVRDSEGVLRELKPLFTDNAATISAESPLVEAFIMGFQLASGNL